MRRFRVGYKYDETLDLLASKEGRRMIAIFQNMPLYKKEIAQSKSRAAGAKNAAKRNKLLAHKRDARSEAEEHAAETVRLACRALKHALAALQEIPVPTQYQKALIPAAVHNVIHLLQHKCGVKFPPEESTEYEKKITLDRVHHPDGEYIPLWERD